jgi:transposase
MKEKRCNRAGIDVSARWLVAAMRRGDRIVEQKFANDAVGHKQLIRWLRPSKNIRAQVCLEATGLYHLEVALALHGAAIAVMVLNPRVAKDYQRACLQRAKTDRVDALGLLDYLERQQFVAWVKPSQEYLLLRHISRRMEQIKKERRAEQNRLHALGALGAGGRVLVADVKQSLKQSARRLQHLQKQALALIDADEYLRQRFELLISIKGIGEISALRILGELCLLPEDMKAAQWVAHAGLDPAPRESGTSVKSPRHISRQGNAQLRAALYMPALVAVRFNAPVKAYYQHLIKKGKKKLVALVAVMRKLLHCIWGMFRHQQVFDPARFTSINFEPER